MTLPTLKLEVDSTGTLPANKRDYEPHTVATRSTRVIKPNFSPYFTASMKVYSVTGTDVAPIYTLLTHGSDYSFVEFYERVSRVTGKEICGALLINRPDLPDKFALTYQALGGWQNVDYEALATAVANLNQNSQTVDWNDITDKPTGFPPAPHLHDSQDVYGLEYLVANLTELVQSIPLGSDASEQDLLNNVAGARLNQLVALRAFLTQADLHLYNRNNPHGLTKGALGLGSVENRHFYTKVVNGQPVEGYASPRTTFNIIKGALLGDILKHIDDHNNPHEVTKAQILLDQVANYAMGVATDITAAVPPTDKYVSPAMVATAVPVIVGGILGHAADDQNPHVLTKAQIGLPLLENFPMAVDTEVDLGVSDERYLSPANIKHLTDGYAASGAGSPAAHIANTENPHKVTKAQILLDQVKNYAVAQASDARFGLADDLYLTPQAIKDGINDSYNGKLNKSAVDAASGAVPLDANRQVPARLLVNVQDYQQFSLKAYHPGAPFAKDEVVFQHIFTRPVTFWMDFINSLAILAFNGTISPTTIEIRKGVDIVDFGPLSTIVFQPSADVGAAAAKIGAFKTNGGVLKFAAGEVLSLRVTSSDAFAGGLQVHLLGTYDTAFSSNPGNGLMPTTTVRPKFLFFNTGQDATDTAVLKKDTLTLPSLAITTATEIAGYDRSYASSFGNSYLGFCVGGRSPTPRVDMEAKVFSNGSISRGFVVAVGRYSSISFGNENQGVTTGGIVDGNSLSNFTDRWTYASSSRTVVTTLGLTMARTQGYTSPANGYIRGGSTLFAEFNGSTYFGKYNYATAALTAVSTSSTLSRYGMSACGNKVVAVAAGGYYQGNPLTTVQRHTFATEALTAGTALGDAVSFGSAAGDVSAAYIAGGSRSTGAVLDTATKYNFNDDTTSSATVLSVGRQNFASVSSTPGWL